MRLSDILKKSSQQKSQPLKKDEPIQEVHEPVKPKIPQQRPEEHFKTDTSSKALAEKVYSESLREIKTIFENIKKGLPINTKIESVAKIVDLIFEENDEIVTISDRATSDIYIYGHSVNVCILSTFLGHALKYDREKCIILGFCALLHDIGMVKTLDLTQKPSKFSNTEQNKIKEHPSDAKEILDTFPALKDEFKELISKVNNIIIQTHERKCGTGYPSGLKGDEIHEYARIIAIVDIFESLTHPRTYRARIIPYEAVRKIIDLADKDLDSEMVKIFVENMSIYPRGSYVKLNTEEIARVIGINRGLPTRPKLQVIINSSGQKQIEYKVIDLATNPMLFIKDPVDETKLHLNDKKLILELKAMRWWVKGL